MAKHRLVYKRPDEIGRCVEFTVGGTPAPGEDASTPAPGEDASTPAPGEDASTPAG